MYMFRLYIIAIAFLVVSCGTYKNTKTTSERTDKENVLPPNTASNKYSKKRQKH